MKIFAVIAVSLFSILKTASLCFSQEKHDRRLIAPFDFSQKIFVIP